MLPNTPVTYVLAIFCYRCLGHGPLRRPETFRCSPRYRVHDPPLEFAPQTVLQTERVIKYATQVKASGACRILESVSLWSNEEARSADKIIAWAVRPRECEIKASSAEGAAEMIALLLRAMSAN
jgi:hypothetical protein